MPRKRNRNRVSLRESWEICETFVGYLVRVDNLLPKGKAELRSIYKKYTNWRTSLGFKGTRFSTTLHNLISSQPPYVEIKQQVVIFLQVEDIKYLHLNLINNDIFEHLSNDSNSKLKNEGTNKVNIKHLLLDKVCREKFLHNDSNIEINLVKGENTYVGKNGVYCSRFLVGKVQEPITIEIANKSAITVFLQNYTFLRNARDFGIIVQENGKRLLSDIPIPPKGTLCVSVSCIFKDMVGIDTTELCLRFIKNETEIALVRMLEFRCDDDLLLSFDELLKPVSEYKPKSTAIMSKFQAHEMDPGVPPPSEVEDNLEKIIKRKDYNVPADIREVFKTGKLLRSHATPVLQTKLTAQNYDDKFKLLLYIEELQCEEDIELFSLSETKITKEKETGLMQIKVPGLAEKRPSVLRGDKVYAYRTNKFGNNGVLYQGFVHFVRMNSIAVGFGRKMVNSHITGMNYNVHFTLNRNPLKLMHRATDLLYSERKLISFLFPSKLEDGANVQYKPLRLFNRALQENNEQVQAITCIARNTMRGFPYVIFGPPGTGKTVTMVEAIRQVHELNPKSHILVCAPSNSACDLLTMRLLDMGRIDKRVLFRIHGLSRSHDWSEKTASSVREVSNHNGSDFYYPSKEYLMKFRIIISTPITAGRLASAKFPVGHFTDIFIDEAGYCMEPECIVPMSGLLSENCRIVLAGDSKQLGPIVHSGLALKHGLGTSLLERLVNTCDIYKRNPDTKTYDKRCITKLLNNYRSHEVIFNVSNNLFYENELKACADEREKIMYCSWKKLKKQNFPLLFHGIQGEDKRESNSPSYFNPQEVAKVIGYVEDLLENRKKLRVMERDIGIIAPYHKQVSKIRFALSKLEKKFPEYSRIKVGSVEEFQGQERPIIIISTVRSNTEHLQYDLKHHLGFMKNEKRFNVAVTRAKSLMIIIGNPRLLNVDPCWNEILKYCVDNGSYVGLPKPLLKENEIIASEDEDSESSTGFEPESAPWWQNE